MCGLSLYICSLCQICPIWGGGRDRGTFYNIGRERTWSCTHKKKSGGIEKSANTCSTPVPRRIVWPCLNHSTSSCTFLAKANSYISGLQCQTSCGKISPGPTEPDKNKEIQASCHSSQCNRRLLSTSKEKVRAVEALQSNKPRWKYGNEVKVLANIIQSLSF